MLEEDVIGHLSFGVADLASAIRFYDAVLRSIGLVRVWTVSDAAGYGRADGQDVLALKAQQEPVIPPGKGFHLAFDAPSRDAVNDFYSAAIQNGGFDAGEPGLRTNYSPTYYAAFVYDPDGHKLEAVHQ